MSRGSTLSLFSGLGTSSVSGPSESGHINIEELSDSKLESLLDEARVSLRLLILETIMFESYHERLLSGQVSLTPTDDSAASGGSRKGSGPVISDTTSETDSQPATTGTSLLDVSHKSHYSGRRRSGSRASLGSRGKSLKLTNEQKNGIASRELDRIETELAQIRLSARRQTRNGMAEIDERTLRLAEMENRRSQLLKGAANAKIKGKNKYDYVKLEECLHDEERNVRRQLEKLKTKNGVMSSQIRRTVERIRLNTKTAEERGPVDQQQLQLENAHCCEQLMEKNREVVVLRNTATNTRMRRLQCQLKLKAEEDRGAEYRETLLKTTRAIEELEAELPNLERKLEKQIVVNARLEEIAKMPDIPTTDDYINLKLLEEKLRTAEKLEERKRNIARLKRSVKRQRAKSASTSRRGQLQDRSTTPGKLIRGRTFNIEFKTVEKKV